MLIQPGARALFGLFGAGGFSREVMPFAATHARQQLLAAGAAEVEVVFVDRQPAAREMNGLPLISEDEFFNRQGVQRFFNITAADSALRQKLAESAVTRGATPLSVVSSSSANYHGNVVGEGAVICGFTTITANARIGRFFHANIYSYVAHDCVIGDFVTFAPRVNCNGNVHIDDHAYIGTAAVLRQGAPDKPLRIGRGAVVGMGAVVTKDVPAGAVVVGNPARARE